MLCIPTDFRKIGCWRGNNDENNQFPNPLVTIDLQSYLTESKAVEYRYFSSRYICFNVIAFVRSTEKVPNFG